LNFSNGASITPGTIGATAHNILCHDKLRTPLLGKRQLAAMNFASLSSTGSGNGDIFYVPIKGAAHEEDDLREVIVIFRMHNDTNLKARDGSVIDLLPKYRIEVDLVRLKCFSSEFAITRSDYLDASINLGYWWAGDASADMNWQAFERTSPYA